MALKPEIEKGFILVVGSASVAAANLPALTHLLATKIDSPVIVTLTRKARRFVTNDALLHFGGAAAVVYDRSPTITDRPNHVWLSSCARAILVYPASAAFIGLLANGLAPDVASTTLLCSHGKPLLVAPNMNQSMWNNPLLQRNVATLRGSGMEIAPTQDGMAPDVHRVIELFEQMLVSNPHSPYQEKQNGCRNHLSVVNDRHRSADPR